MTGDKADLSARLGAAPVVDRLSDAEATELLALVRAVRRSRFTAMMASIDEALGHLPRVLRGPAKKILGV